MKLSVTLRRGGRRSPGQLQDASPGSRRVGDERRVQAVVVREDPQPAPARAHA